ncbi:MAG: DNA internalization-related competence protein ComEC/Rec2 [Azoarcus sp.]|jgi:competence protein ComEC|nr:DNA internalization-related competence protein ComEC/Rec2 [Azoarcus sp.]
MGANVLGILAGVCLLQAAAVLPAWAEWGWLAAVAALAAILYFSRMRRRARTARGANAAWALALVAAVGAGYAHAAWRAEARLADALDSALEGRDILLTGIVASLPGEDTESARFVFEVEHAESAGAARHGVPRRIVLSWYRAHGRAARLEREIPALQAGERWRLPVRLWRPHASAVPGGFDYEAWLLERNLRATGYVRGEGRRLAENSGGFMHSVHRLRARIRQQFAAALPRAPYRGILTALAIGDQSAITPEQWEILRRTGVQHLVAISGLHVSLAALAAGGLGAALWRRIPPLTLRCPARHAGAVAGLAAAAGYALLAGLGIPVQRALIMLLAAALALLARRGARMRNALALALAAVLIVDPWATLAAGFWLSFGAVAVILLVAGGRSAPLRGWRAAARLQGAITLATAPVLVILFQGFSLAAPLANAFAIPLVSFAIAPLALIAALCPAAGLLELAHLLLAWMMAALQWLAAWSLALHEHPLPPPWLSGAALAAATLLILPRGTPARLAALALLGGFLLWQPPRPPPGEFNAAVLDVGQGLAIHVRTARHDALYDSGPLYRTNDAGERVVAPYLRALGVRRLDAVMISHDDTDHAGGLESVRARLEIGAIIAGDGETGIAPGVGANGNRVAPRKSEPGSAPGGPCAAGLRWQWDGVDFTVLAPDELPPGRRGNAQSCVVRISGAGGAALLLTGDIGRAGEEKLTRQYGAALASTAVVAAHHGSRTSSSAAFIAAVHPQAAIFSAGHRNRYGHPHPQVLARWEAAGARNLRTDSGGTILLESAGAAMRIAAWREIRPRYWHGR